MYGDTGNAMTSYYQVVLLNIVFVLLAERNNLSERRPRIEKEQTIL